MKDDNVQLLLKNVRVKYAKVVRPGKAYDDDKPDEWSVNLYVTEEDAKALDAHNVAYKTDKDGDEYYYAKRAVKSTKGDDVKPPTIVDAAKAPWNGEDIGNGSVCNVFVTLFPWRKKDRSGVLLYLNAMQVVNHVPYRKSDADNFDAISDGSAGAKEDDLPF